MTRHQKDMPQPLLVTVTQAAKMLGVSRAMVYKLTSKGELRLVHLGRAARVSVADLRRLIQAHENEKGTQ
ncbi:MAG: helix-turn-helix domain-containing protein [Ktedonobacteraceae bacterium]